jgi:hypothetical protein
MHGLDAAAQIREETIDLVVRRYRLELTRRGSDYSKYCIIE